MQIYILVRRRSAYIDLEIKETAKNKKKSFRAQLPTKSVARPENNQDPSQKRRSAKSYHATAWTLIDLYVYDIDLQTDLQYRIGRVSAWELAVIMIKIKVHPPMISMTTQRQERRQKNKDCVATALYRWRIQGNRKKENIATTSTAMGQIFGKEKPLKEVLRENKRMINRAVRELDREKAALEREEKRLQIEIKKAAKENQMGAVKIMAKVC